MEQEEAKVRAESLRYRLQVRLGMVLRAARDQENAAVAARAELIRKTLAAIAIEDAEWVDQKAARAIAALDPEVRVLQDEVGVEEHGTPALPKWVRYLLVTVPILAVLIVVGIVVARRRMKREIDADALAHLDRGQ